VNKIKQQQQSRARAAFVKNEENNTRKVGEPFLSKHLLEDVKLSNRFIRNDTLVKLVLEVDQIFPF